MTVETLTLTKAATARIKDILAEHGAGKIGVRIGVRNAGCSGMAYTMEFAESSNADDAVVEHDGVTVIIDAEAATYLVGAEMDYAEGELHAGFVFNNPNEKGRCGCGESFHV